MPPPGLPRLAPHGIPYGFPHYAKLRGNLFPGHSIRAQAANFFRFAAIHFAPSAAGCGPFRHSTRPKNNLPDLPRCEAQGLCDCGTAMAQAEKVKDYRGQHFWGSLHDADFAV